MALVFAAAMPPSLSRPSRLAILWSRLRHTDMRTHRQGPADHRLLLELERLAEVSPHLLEDLGFEEQATGVYERQLWTLGNVTVAVDTDGAATAWIGDSRPHGA